MCHGTATVLRSLCMFLWEDCFAVWESGYCLISMVCTVNNVYNCFWSATWHQKWGFQGVSFNTDVCVHLGSSWCYNVIIFSTNWCFSEHTVQGVNTGCTKQYEFTGCDYMCESVCEICVSDCRKHTGCSVMYVQLSFLHTVWVHRSPGCCDTLYISLWLTLF